MFIYQIYLHVLLYIDYKGAPPELAEKIINDKNAVLSIQVDGEFFIISWKWKAMPIEILFKLEEEFEVGNPLAENSAEKVYSQ